MGFLDAASPFCLSLTRKALLNFHRERLLSAEQMSVSSLQTEGRHSVTVGLQSPFYLVHSMAVFDFTISKENFVFAGIT